MLSYLLKIAYQTLAFTNFHQLQCCNKTKLCSALQSEVYWLLAIQITGNVHHKINADYKFIIQQRCTYSHPFTGQTKTLATKWNVHLWTLAMQTTKTRHAMLTTISRVHHPCKVRNIQAFSPIQELDKRPGETWTMDIGNLHYSLDIDVDKNTPRFIWDMTFLSLVLLCVTIFPESRFTIP